MPCASALTTATTPASTVGPICISWARRRTASGPSTGRRRTNEHPRGEFFAHQAAAAANPQRRQAAARQAHCGDEGPGQGSLHGFLPQYPYHLLAGILRATGGRLHRGEPDLRHVL